MPAGQIDSPREVVIDSGSPEVSWRRGSVAKHRNRQAASSAKNLDFAAMSCVLADGRWRVGDQF